MNAFFSPRMCWGCFFVCPFRISVKVGVLTGVFVVVLAVNLLKGGGAFPSPLGIECGSYAFWGATGFIFVWVLGVSL